MITGTSASASVIISFQGTSETGNIDPELSWTLDITVDNGGGGSIYDQTWDGDDITDMTFTRGSSQLTGIPCSVSLLVETTDSGEFNVTLLAYLKIPIECDSGSYLWFDHDLMGGGPGDYHTTRTTGGLKESWLHYGWSVSPMSNPAVPEPTSAIVWACLLTVGCLGKRSFYSLSNRSRPKSTNV